MVTNLTGLKAAENLVDIVTYNNYITGGVFMGMFLIALFFIMVFILLRKSEPKHAIWVASFLAFMFSLFFGAINMVNYQFMIGFLAIFIFTTIYIAMQQRATS